MITECLPQLPAPASAAIPGYEPTALAAWGQPASTPPWAPGQGGAARDFGRAGVDPVGSVAAAGPPDGEPSPASNANGLAARLRRRGTLRPGGDGVRLAGGWGRAGSGTAAAQPPDFSSWYDPSPRSGPAPSAEPGADPAGQAGSGYPRQGSRRPGPAPWTGSAPNSGSGLRRGARAPACGSSWCCSPYWARAPPLSWRCGTTPAVPRPGRAVPAPRARHQAPRRAPGPLPADPRCHQPSPGLAAGGLGYGDPPGRHGRNGRLQHRRTRHLDAVHHRPPDLPAGPGGEREHPHRPHAAHLPGRHGAGSGVHQGRIAGSGPLSRLPPVGLGAATIRGTRGSAWKFTWQDNGVSQEAIDLLMVLQTPAGTQSYALYMTGPASMWPQLRPTFDEAAETFARGPDPARYRFCVVSTSRWPPRDPCAAGGSIGVLDVLQAPLDLGLSAGLPIRPGAAHPGAGQRLRYAVGAAASVIGGHAPAAFLLPQRIQAAELAGRPAKRGEHRRGDLLRRTRGGHLGVGHAGRLGGLAVAVAWRWPWPGRWRPVP